MTHDAYASCTKYWLVRSFHCTIALDDFRRLHVKDAMMLYFDQQLIRAAPFSCYAGVALQNVS